MCVLITLQKWQKLELDGTFAAICLWYENIPNASYFLTRWQINKSKLCRTVDHSEHVRLLVLSKLAINRVKYKEKMFYIEKLIVTVDLILPARLPPPPSHFDHYPLGVTIEKKK